VGAGDRDAGVVDSSCRDDPDEWLVIGDSHVPVEMTALTIPTCGSSSAMRASPSSIMALVTPIVASVIDDSDAPVELTALTNRVVAPIIDDSDAPVELTALTNRVVAPIIDDSDAPVELTALTNPVARSRARAPGRDLLGRAGTVVIRQFPECHA
jgi:hypothetical protein